MFEQYSERSKWNVWNNLWALKKERHWSKSSNFELYHVALQTYKEKWVENQQNTDFFPPRTLPTESISRVLSSSHEHPLTVLLRQSGCPLPTSTHSHCTFGTRWLLQGYALFCGTWPGTHVNFYSSNSCPGCKITQSQIFFFHSVDE